MAEKKLRLSDPKTKGWEMYKCTPQGCEQAVKVSIDESPLGRFFLSRFQGIDPRACYVLTPANPTISNQLKNLKKMEKCMDPDLKRFIKNPLKEKILEEGAIECQ